MLISILLDNSLSPTLKVMEIIFCAVAVILALSLHESFHGIAALSMGDSTAKDQGRITLNPKKHLNPVGAIMLLLFGFGWANPVIVNPNNFRNRKAGNIIVSLAGPLSNFLFAFIGTFLFYLLYYVAGLNNIEFLGNVAYFFQIFSITNLGLGVFNLIPIPPLDGSKVLYEILPYKAKYKYLSLERYSMYFFLGIILLDRVLPVNLISLAVSGLWNLFSNGAIGILGLFIH